MDIQTQITISQKGDNAFDQQNIAMSPITTEVIVIDNDKKAH